MNYSRREMDIAKRAVGFDANKVGLRVILDSNLAINYILNSLGVTFDDEGHLDLDSQRAYDKLNAYGIYILDKNLWRNLPIGLRNSTRELIQDLPKDLRKKAKSFCAISFDEMKKQDGVAQYVARMRREYKSYIEGLN